jgi:hypothetical protein
MKKYLILNDKGFATCIVHSTNQPDNSVECNIDIGEPPEPGYLFHFESQEWVKQPNEQRFFGLNAKALSRRKELLYASDWTQLPNGPLTLEVQQQWSTYRQALRDITAQSDYPFNVVWPTPPA